VPTILQQLAAGDETAVARCLEEYGGLVWSLASKYLDGRRSEIEDAVQDAFVTVWQSASRFDPAKGSEAAFVATLARRRIIDARRRAEARQDLVEKAVAAESAVAPMLSSEEMSRLGQRFVQLPAEERTALWFVVSRGMSHREIAVVTDVPVGTVKSRLRRALLRLQQAFGVESEQRSIAAGEVAT
jgi:RNA polymerase sigma-70 factor (ECF subfamily)